MSKKQPKRHIVILGGQAYQDEDPLPEKTDGMEFWAQNQLEQWIKPKWSYSCESVNNVAMLAEVIDRWYEIHKPGRTGERRAKRVRGRAGGFTGKVWVQGWSRGTRGPRARSENYPIHEVPALAPHANYLGGTFSYMVAHAVLEKVDKISFHWMAKGVLRSKHEPRDAQSSLDYWLGLAEGRGIEVDCGDLWLLRSWWGGRYGYDGMPPEWHRDEAEAQYLRYFLDDTA